MPRFLSAIRHRPIPTALGALVCSVMAPAALAAEDIPPAADAVLAQQMEQFRAPVPGSVFALQPFRNAATATAEDGTVYTLTSLNPHINIWYVLEIAPPNTRAASYHLELADPDTSSLALSTGAAPALTVMRDGEASDCRDWRAEIEEARQSALPYAPICDWAAYLRNPVSGNRSTKEAVADFLRDNVLFGDSIVNMIKGSFYEDAFMVSSDEFEAEVVNDGVEVLGAALLDRAPQMRPYMGFDVIGTDGGLMQAGSWYEIEDAPGIYASVVQPGMVSREILNSGGAGWPDGVESRADVYMVAFDMQQFEIGYEVGTDHPRVNWSPRPSGRGGRHYEGQGPDGFGTTDPLVTVGVLNPSKADRVAATFTGGFKREHGAWRFGPYAQANWGHHYGFLENGVMLSRLWPTLATLYVLDDGSVHMETWTEEHEALLPRIVFARQNGVPVIEDGVPGSQVASWGGGNWSGSANADLRTLRGGACLRTVGGRQFMIYAYFSSATPSGMARTFQAYQCDYAMLLDMNSQEHTYMALYTHEEDGIKPHHLVQGMSAIDGRGRSGEVYPRFVSQPDNRDFFYLLRKD
ncbi:hypothetical protein [Anianabacter salinae]|uniref:hypothetical protein n=1 Tax=Anianabacter salinae TaxID=2851023 RepID=UPI00225E06E4|nr:hypothetical protein [Anianabacter salinae]MBV0911809.1 hypothetical protein [Anianabacter salinae]